MVRPKTITGDAGHPAQSRSARLVGIVLLVGATACCASPVVLVEEGLHAMAVGIAEPVPWEDTTRMLPFTAAVLTIAVVAGVILGVAICSSDERRLALARRVHVFVVLTGLAFLGWSATAAAFLLPFIDAGIGLTGIARSTERAVVLSVGSASATLALSGLAILICSRRIGDALADRVFGLGSRSCRRCGHPLDSGTCPECGEPRLGHAPSTGAGS